jgi:hypothetical protein
MNMHHRLKVLEQRAQHEEWQRRLREGEADYAMTGAYPLPEAPVQKPIGPDVSQGAKQWSAPHSHSE